MRRNNPYGHRLAVPRRTAAFSAENPGKFMRGIRHRPPRCEQLIGTLDF